MGRHTVITLAVSWDGLELIVQRRREIIVRTAGGGVCRGHGSKWRPSTLGRHGQEWLHRARAGFAVVKLVVTFYFVKFRDRSGEWRLFAPSLFPSHLSLASSLALLLSSMPPSDPTGAASQSG